MGFRGVNDRYKKAMTVNIMALMKMDRPCVRPTSE